MEMQTIDGHTPFRHHMTRNGTVDTARNEQKSSPRRSDRHTVRALDEIGEYERDIVLADIHADGERRFVYVHRQRALRVFEQPTAQFATEFDRSERVFFIAAVRLDLERSAFADKPCLLASLSRNMYCIKESPPDVWWTTMLK